MPNIFNETINKLLTLIFFIVTLTFSSHSLATDKELIICLGGGMEERLPHTIELLKEKKNADLLLSGGYTSPNISEAKAMEDWIQKKYLKIKNHQVLLEEKSLDTIGNAIFSRMLLDKLKSKDYKNIILVTSDYHMKRAMYLFVNIFGDDFNIVASPAVTSDSERKNRAEHEKVALDLSKVMFALARKGNVKDFYNIASITDPKFMKALEDPTQLEQLQQYKKQLQK